MTDKKQFQSVLDFRPQFENIIDALAPDIHFSYSAIMNNSIIQTYFNMISLEYYGFEYFQLLRLNKLEFELSDKTLNLTILEMAYNIIKQIVARKWRYSEYIAYDMYILPLRIKKYVNAMNYRFIDVETVTKKTISKLVSQPSRVVIEKLVDQYHDDRINNIIGQFKAANNDDAEFKLTLFKSILLFVNEGESLVYQKFGKEFADNFFKEVEVFDKYKANNINAKEKKHILKTVDEMFNISIMVILMISDAMKAGVWKKIKAAESRRVEMEVTQRTIEEANKRLQLISKQEKEVQRIEVKK